MVDENEVTKVRDGGEQQGRAQAGLSQHWPA